MKENVNLHEYSYDGYTFVTNFGTYEKAVEYAQENNGELVELGFTNGADAPVLNSNGNLLGCKKPFRVELPAEYSVLYSDDETFQEVAEKLLIEKKHIESDVALEDWLSDQNIASADRIIILKDGELNTVTTRERIKYLMLANVYELGVKIPTQE